VDLFLFFLNKDSKIHQRQSTGFLEDSGIKNQPISGSFFLKNNSPYSSSDLTIHLNSCRYVNAYIEKDLPFYPRANSREEVIHNIPHSGIFISLSNIIVPENQSQEKNLFI